MDLHARLLNLQNRIAGITLDDSAFYTNLLAKVVRAGNMRRPTAVKPDPVVSMAVVETVVVAAAASAWALLNRAKTNERYLAWVENTWSVLAMLNKQATTQLPPRRGRGPRNLTYPGVVERSLEPCLRL